MTSRRAWSGILAGGVFVVLVGCNAILGNEEGTPRAPVDAAAEVTSVTPPDAGNEECKLGERRCFGLCKRIDDPDVGCASASCTACDPKSVDGLAKCKNRDGSGFRCDFDLCAKGFQDCDQNRANGCERSLVDKDACGSCTTKCGGGTPFCAETSTAGTYACVSSCALGTTPCDSACVDTQNDVRNCGGCGNVCERARARAKCVGGSCAFTCVEGTKDCNGACVSVADTAYCAGCKPCPQYPNMVATCTNGGCSHTCKPGYDDCDGKLENGCESSTRCGTPCQSNSNCTIGQFCCSAKCQPLTQLCAIGAK